MSSPYVKFAQYVFVIIINVSFIITILRSDNYNLYLFGDN